MPAPDAHPAPPDALLGDVPAEPDGPLPHVPRCLNCGEPVTLTYCPRCGQESKNYTAALRPLLAEALAEWVSWDSKIFRTLLPLLFRPGVLTNEYNRGRRVRYLSPLKMYLVISALFFLVVGWRHPVHLPPNVPVTANTGAAIAPGVHINVSSTHTPVPMAVAVVKVDKGDFITLNGHRRSLSDLPPTIAAYDAQQRSLPVARRDSPALRPILRQIIKAKESPKAFLQTVGASLLDNAPKMMFFLVPLFAVLLKLTYWRSRRLYVEHLIFALHSHAFVYLALIGIIFIPDRAGALAALLSLTVPVYLYLALRAVYEQSVWKTGFKMLWLGTNYLLLLTFALLITAGIAFLLA